jgi:hypothetical protein
MCRHVQNSRNIQDVLFYTICDLSTVNDAIYITKTSIPPLHYFTHFKTVKSKSHFIRVSTKHHTRLLSQLILPVCVKKRDFHFYFFSSPRSFPSPFSIFSWVEKGDRKTLGSSKAGHRKSTACYFWKLFDLIVRVGIWEPLSPPTSFSAVLKDKHQLSKMCLAILFIPLSLPKCVTCVGQFCFTNHPIRAQPEDNARSTAKLHNQVKEAWYTDEI